MPGTTIQKGQRTISSFFASKPRAAGAAPPAHDEERAPKRARREEAPQNVDPGGPGQGGSRSAAAGLPAQQPPLRAAAAARSSAAAAAIPPREPRRQQKAAVKLVTGRYGNGAAPPAAAAGPRGTQKLTPLEEQVAALQAQHPGVLLAIEVGYKIRFFGADAETAARVCNIAAFQDRSFLTASVPVGRLPVHVRRLVAAGHKVGVVRQVETAALKAISDSKYQPFERKLTALYTAATLDAALRADKIGEEAGVGATQELELLSADSVVTHYLLCVVEGAMEEGGGGAARRGGGGGGAHVGLLAVETSTGDVMWGCCRAGGVQCDLEAILLSLQPSEIVVGGPLGASTQRLLRSYQDATPGCRLETLDAAEPSSVVIAGEAGGGGGGGGVYLDAATLGRVRCFYESLPGAGAGQADAGAGALARVLSQPPLVVLALDAALRFLQPFGLAGVLGLVEVFRPLEAPAALRMGANALRQLEVLAAGPEGKAAGSLLHLMDRTATPAGGRLLRAWLTAPLADRAALLRRQAAVAELAEQGQAGPLAALPKLLRKLPDLERGLARMLHGTSSPSEAVGVLRALQRAAPVLAAGDAAGASAPTAPLLTTLLGAAAAPEVGEAAEKLLTQLNTDAAMANDYVALFASREAFPGVFEHKEALAEAERHLQGLLPHLARAAGVARLEFVSIQNQGAYLLELPAARTNVCGTKKANRFLAPEVKAAALSLDVARDRLQAECARAWGSFLAAACQHLPTFRAASQALAHMDALLSLATLARSPGYCRPEFVGDDEAPRLLLGGARHPVLDARLGAAAVPNDLELRWDGQRCAVITGPNMGGKSSLLRTAALMVLMAQVGSYVPAASARMHVHDALWTRMGASDNLLMGRSTFLEELGDAAQILNNATARSLVIVDELGRGTATLDGVAIAAATLEALLRIGCCTLFVTHYPQVAEVALAHPDMVGAWHTSFLLLDPEPPAGEGGAERSAGAAAAVSQPRRAAASPTGWQGAPAPALGAQQQRQLQQGEAGEGEGEEGLAAAAASAGGAHRAVVAAAAAAPAAGAAGGVPRVLFLYKLAPGAADQSFGLNVARLAGLPEAVVAVAARAAGDMRARAPAGGVAAAVHALLSSWAAGGDGGGGGGDAAKGAAAREEGYGAALVVAEEEGGGRGSGRRLEDAQALQSQARALAARWSR